MPRSAIGSAALPGARRRDRGHGPPNGARQEGACQEGACQEQPAKREPTGMRSLLLASLSSILAMSFAGSAEASDKTVVTLGTATPGGGFPVYGEALALSVNETDPSLEVRPTNTAGSFENIPLLEAGTLDIGLVPGAAPLAASNRIRRPQANVPLIFALYPPPGMCILRA